MPDDQKPYPDDAHRKVLVSFNMNTLRNLDAEAHSQDRNRSAQINRILTERYQGEGR